MAYNNNIIRISKTGIVATGIGDYLIDTTENGTQKFYPLFATFSITAANGIVIVPTFSIGTNASTYNNIIPASLLTGLTTIDKMTKIDISSATGIIPANTGIYARVSVPATATNCTVDVHLFGYYK